MRLASTLSSLLAIGLLVQGHPHHDYDLLAVTRQGPVRGIQVHKKVNGFLGIPFAKPPVGNLRFEPPQPLSVLPLPETATVFNATKFGPVCHQFHYDTVLGKGVVETSGQSEDCLSLNIWVPRRKNRNRKLRLPVFVWSYGGAFAEGGGSMPLYNPVEFVVENKDIIVVTWNYRTNLFGFPNSPALNAQNLGIRDQRVALEWLRDNIAGFGGDPKHIIFGGQSAGADSGHSMLYSHADDPIMVGIAMQSGAVQVINAQTFNEDGEFVRIATTIGCANNNRTKELECMRGMDATTLAHAMSNTTMNGFGSAPGGTPMVDNITIFTLEEYKARGRAGKFARVPTLIGNTNNEGDSVLNWSPDCGINKTLSDSLTSLIFDCNIKLESEFRHLHGVPVWRYRYLGVFPEVTPYKWLGAYHVGDVPMLMGTYNMVLNASSRTNGATRKASQYYQNVFGTFIRNPASGLKTVHGWPTFNPDTSSLIELFRNNSSFARFISSAEFDKYCTNPAQIDWLSVLKGPPKC